MLCTDQYMIAKETVFEPHGLSLRGPRTAKVPLSKTYPPQNARKQLVRWLEVVPVSMLALQCLALH